MVAFIRGVAERFWAWYERYYTLNVAVALTLFTWQLVHLYWLGSDVIAERLFGVSYFPVSGVWQWLLVVVDYTEIPAIIGTTTLYVFELRRALAHGGGWSGKVWKLAGLMILLNSQWLHLFWLTDEFVVEVLRGGAGTVLPPALAWVAILIDYLELPVIFDITWRFVTALSRGRGLDFIRKEFS